LGFINVDSQGTWSLSTISLTGLENAPNALGILQAPVQVGVQFDPDGNESITLGVNFGNPIAGVRGGVVLGDDFGAYVGVSYFGVNATLNFHFNDPSTPPEQGDGPWFYHPDPYQL
jgi:hypothetical protein